MRALLERVPELDPAEIDDVILGNANGAGEDNRDVARMAVLLAGLPTSVPGATVNRLCGSSLEAAIQAARAIEMRRRRGDAGRRGGVDEPGALGAAEARARLSRPGHETLYSTTLGWRMVNPEMPEQWTIALGESAEKLAGMYEISRQEQDEFALRSHTAGGARPTTRGRWARWCRSRGSSSSATRGSAPTPRWRSSKS